jgi:hypothetical protein
MSSRHVDIHPEAIVEAQAAYRWYRERSPSAAQRPILSSLIWRWRV